MLHLLLIPFQKIPTKLAVRCVPCHRVENKLALSFRQTLESSLTASRPLMGNRVLDLPTLQGPLQDQTIEPTGKDPACRFCSCEKHHDQGHQLTTSNCYEQYRHEWKY